MKPIIGFWGGSNAYKETVRINEIEELLRRRSGYGTLADMVAPEAFALSKSSASWRGLPAYGTLADWR
jgi:hypothetical protein